MWTFLFVADTDNKTACVRAGLFFSTQLLGFVMRYIADEQIISLSRHVIGQ